MQRTRLQLRVAFNIYGLYGLYGLLTAVEGKGRRFSNLPLNLKDIVESGKVLRVVSN